MEKTESEEKQQMISGGKLFAGISGGEIVVTLSRQLSWSHFLVLIPLKSQEARQLYAQSAIEEMPGIW